MSRSITNNFGVTRNYNIVTVKIMVNKKMPPVLKYQTRGNACNLL
jgi:hypothetical protein